MNVINRFYKNINEDLSKFSSLFVHIINPYKTQNKNSNLKAYYHKKNAIYDSTYKDWEKINKDYIAIGNDIRKAIKTYAE